MRGMNVRGLVGGEGLGRFGEKDEGGVAGGGFEGMGTYSGP